MFGLGGRRQLPVGSAEATSRSDDYEEDFGADPPRSDLEPRGADTQWPAQVTTDTCTGDNTWMFLHEFPLHKIKNVK